MVGIGFDVHIRSAKRPLVLGGVKISDKNGLAGHSDADVLLHAVIDAILGARGKGDIGDHFPDTDKRYKGASSVRLLKETLEKVGRINLVNVDVTVIMDRPKLAEFKKRISKNLAGLLGISEGQVNVKAKTSEGLLRNCVACQAIVQIE